MQLDIMSMPKGWKSPEHTGTVFEKSQMLEQMPLPTKLARPMVEPRVFKYPIKKIELFEADTGKKLHTKELQYLTIDPIESNYTLVLISPAQAFPLPLRNILDVKAISTSVVEFDFWGTGTIGITGVGSIGINDTKYVAKIKTDEKYTPSLPDLLKELKALENDSSYWKYDTLTFHGVTVEIYSQTPFLAEGEQIIWQNPKSEFIDNKRQVTAIDAVTNFRIFQYDYVQHKGSAILFPLLQNVKVSNQKHTMATSSVGSYSDFSHKLTGIKNIRSNNVVGDTIFYAQDNPLITFAGITDPDMLYNAVTVLRKQYDSLIAKRQHSEVAGSESPAMEHICGKCTSINSSDSRFCNRCGSELSSNPILFDNSEYVGKKIVQHPELEKSERYQKLVQRIDQYKPGWDKYGVIQYKTEYIAILQREWGHLVEFIIAFDDLTREGYRLMAIDEGKSGGDSSPGFTGGVNSYYYFQKMKYVK
jgi:hypothetical protein